MSQKYLVAGCKPWNRRLFDEVISKFPGNWRYVEHREDLSRAVAEDLTPRYIFFLHWSWKVPEEIIQAHECVCFHMTDVPYGRGGSPLQNLIIRGHKETRVTALRMTEEMDAGPQYAKKRLVLAGSAEEIYMRAGQLSAAIIKDMITAHVAPTPQEGEPTIFKRRQAEESEIHEVSSLEALHDFIRMLDADGYPRAFIRYKGLCFEFDRACLYDGKVVADVAITIQEDD